MESKGAVLRTGTCTAHHGVETVSGVRVTTEVLAARVGWLAALVAEVGQAALARAWNPGALAALSAGSTMDGRRMPTFAYKALAATIGWEPVPDGVYAVSRVVWMGMELAGRQARSAQYRAQAVAALAPSNLAERHRPASVDEVTWRNTGRAVTRYVNPTDGPVRPRPSHLCVLEPVPPRVPHLVPLDATDMQFHTRTLSEIEEDGTRCLTVTLHLPLVERPVAKTDWSQVSFHVRLPARYAADDVRPPTLRVDGDGRVRVSVPVDLTPTVPAPTALDHSAVRVLGVDWGVRRALTGALTRMDGDTIVVDGRPLHFDTSALQRRTHLLRVEGEKLRKKADHHTRLLTGKPDSVLERKRDLLLTEAARVDARRHGLNLELARLAAVWTIKQAQAAGAQVIALEDLSTMEHKGHGRRNNLGSSNAVRGLIQTAILEAAALAGIRVVLVPARGTSSTCGRCGGKVQHRNHSGKNSVTGYAWATCTACPMRLDRDHAAAEHIGIRALLKLTTGSISRPEGLKVRRQRSPRNSLTDAGRHRAQPPRSAPKLERKRARAAAGKNQKAHKTAAQAAGTPSPSPGVSRVKNAPTPQRRDVAGLGAGRRVAPHPPVMVGHRSAGPDTQGTMQVGSQCRRTMLEHPEDQLWGLLHTYRSRVRATPVMYRDGT